MRIIRAIITGAMVGAALFLLPFFILRGLLFFLFIGLLIRFLFSGRSYRRFRGRGIDPAFTDKIRSMSEEEYRNFKQDFSGGCGRNARWQDKASTPVIID